MNLFGGRYFPCTFILIAFLLLPKYAYFYALPTLYSSDGLVIVLNKTNFNEQISNKLYLLFVNFYASWCGHCKSYAPIYTSLSEKYEKWSSIIKFAAIDCANAEHNDICIQHHISSFPTLMYFYPNAHSAITSSAHRMETFYNTTQFLRGLNTVFNSMKNVPAHFPDYKFHDWKYIQELLKQTNKNIIVVGQKNKNIALGLELILNFINIKKLTVIRVEYSNLKIKFDQSKLATIFKISGNSVIPFTSSKNGSDTYQVTVDIIKEFRLEKEVDLNKMFPKSSARELEYNRRQAVIEHNSQSIVYDTLYKRLLSKVYVEDLESVLHYTFFRELPRQAELNDTRKLVLYNFVKALDRYLPFEALPKGPGRFLNQFSSWLGGQTLNHQVLKSKELLQFYKQKGLEREFNHKEEWIGCKGSAPSLRGYPCGMWTLFHTLTVGMWNRYNSESGYILLAGVGKHETKIEALALLFTIREYVKHFFSCSDCAQNFVKASSQLTGHEPAGSAGKENVHLIRSPTDAVVWFWYTHNRVNKRLAGDLSEDPMFPKIQFPPTLTCPQCVVYPNTSTTLTPGDPETSYWDRKSILKFLVNHYSASNIVVGRERLSGSGPNPFSSLIHVFKSIKLTFFSLLGMPQKSVPPIDNFSLPPHSQRDPSHLRALGVVEEIPESGYLSCFVLWAVSFVLLILMYTCHRLRNRGPSLAGLVRKKGNRAAPSYLIRSLYNLGAGAEKMKV